MSSSPDTTIFHLLPAWRRGPFSLVTSILVHGTALLVLIFGFKHLPRIGEKYRPQRYAVRVLRQDDLVAPRMRSAGRAASRSAPHSVSHSTPSAGHTAPPPAVPPDLKQLVSKAQTLIQPDAPTDIKLLQPVKVPTMVRWASENNLKIIVPAPPQPITSVESRASVKTPNRERMPADIKMSSTAFATKAPTLPPATTSPIVVHRQEPVTHVPETAAKTAIPPAPAQIVSLSDVQSKQTITPVPMANYAPPARSLNSLTAGHTENSTETASDNGKPAINQKEAAAGQGAADKQEKTTPGTGAAVAKLDANTGPGQAAAGAAATGNDPSITRLSLPKDGHFGVVVVGQSLAEQYPETVDLWSGKLIYTVYLHVGPGKSWILQYSMARDPAAPAGANTRPEPPWPFDIARPHLDPGDFNSDAIMVHGFVNPAGKFERLAVVFPTEFQKSKMVLNALQQWQFRPAKQNGQIASVEVLLIIPEETD